MIERWRWRSWLRTAQAMVALSLARLLVETIPFHRWRNMLGPTAENADQLPLASDKAKYLAADGSVRGLTPEVRELVRAQVRAAAGDAMRTQLPELPRREDVAGSTLTASLRSRS